MNSKRIMVLFAVAILVASPFLSLGGVDSDATDANATQSKGRTVVIEDMPYATATAGVLKAAVFSYVTDVLSMTLANTNFPTFFPITAINNDAKVSLEFSAYSELKNMHSDLTETVCKVTIKNLNMSYTHSGENVDILNVKESSSFADLLVKIYGTGQVAAGDVVTLTGEMSYYLSNATVYELKDYEAAADDKYVKSMEFAKKYVLATSEINISLAGYDKVLFSMETVKYQDLELENNLHNRNASKIGVGSKLDWISIDQYINLNESLKVTCKGESGTTGSETMNESTKKKEGGEIAAADLRDKDSMVVSDIGYPGGLFEGSSYAELKTLIGQYGSISDNAAKAKTLCNNLLKDAHRPADNGASSIDPIFIVVGVVAVGLVAAVGCIWFIGRKS